MTKHQTTSVRTAATISLLAGVWLFLSPWVYRVESIHSAWNSWILGILIVAFAATRISNPLTTRGFSILNMLCGAWVFASPWLYLYSLDTHRMINSLCIGLIVFIVSAIAVSFGQITHPITHSTLPPPVRP